MIIWSYYRGMKPRTGKFWTTVTVNLTKCEVEISNAFLSIRTVTRLTITPPGGLIITFNIILLPLVFHTTFILRLNTLRSVFHDATPVSIKRL